MKLAFVSALLVAVGAGAAAAPPAWAQDGPRQLGGAPVVPAPAPARPSAPPPAQLGNAPAAAPARPDSAAARPAAASAPAPAPTAPAAPVYAPPAAPGQLPGSNLPAPRFQVGLKSGRVYSATDVEVKTPLFGRSHLLLNGQQRVDFTDVAFYEDETGHYVRTTLPRSSREATLRRDRTGRISLYSTLSTSYSPGMYGPGGFGYGGFGYGGFGGGYPYGGYRTVKTEYFSKDNGPIQSLTLRNLALATADNAGAQALLGKARGYQTTTALCYVAGGGLLVGGLVQSLRPGAAGISPLVYAAVPVLIVPIVLQSKSGQAQRQAIALYNSAQ